MKKGKYFKYIKNIPLISPHYLKESNQNRTVFHIKQFILKNIPVYIVKKINNL